MQYTYITYPTQIPEFESVVGVDIETNGLDALTDRVLLLQVADTKHCYIFDLRVLPVSFINKVLEALTKRKCVFHNAKFDLKFLTKQYSVYFRDIFDTMVAKYLTIAGKGTPFISLKSLASEYLGVALDKEQQGSFLSPTLTFTQAQLEYAAQDATVLIPLYHVLVSELEKLNLNTVAALEFKLIPVVVKMELHGVLVNTAALQKLVLDLEKEAAETEQEVYAVAKKVFNPRSPKQVKEVFHAAGISVDSTEEHVIKFIDHALPKALLKYRKLYKLLSSFGKTLSLHIQGDGRIRSTFNQLGTATGRFSSSDINLQNIPATQQFRSLFIAPPGYKLITADFSQIELRLAGILSGEQSILEEYKKPDADLHRLTASKIFQVSPDEVTPEMRKHGKTGNFSCAYGTGAASLAMKQGIPLELAEKIVSGFWNGYPQFRMFVEKVGNEVIKSGCVRTLIGRVRWFEFPDATDPFFKSKVAAIKREAANFVIQGLAADIMKYALVLVASAIPNNSTIIMTIHDEMVVEAPEAQVEEVAHIVKEQMEAAAFRIVNAPIPANIAIGDCWIK